MGKINYNRPTDKIKGRHIESMVDIGVTEELNKGFKKQFRERLKNLKKEKEQDQLRVKSIFKKASPKLIKRRKILE